MSIDCICIIIVFFLTSRIQDYKSKYYMKIDWCKFSAEKNIYKPSILILKLQSKHFWLSSWES